jgi:hypothetical protein
MVHSFAITYRIAKECKTEYVWNKCARKTSPFLSFGDLWIQTCKIKIFLCTSTFNLLLFIEPEEVHHHHKKTLGCFPNYCYRISSGSPHMHSVPNFSNGMKCYIIHCTFILGSADFFQSILTHRTENKTLLIQRRLRSG